MKQLRKAILGLLMAASSAVLCNEEPTMQVENKFNYWGIGVGIPTLVSVKFGHREQKGRHGFEYGVGMTPLVVVTEGHVFGSYLYYPNPDLTSQSYVGVGLRAGGLLDTRHKFGYIAPGVMLGKEYKAGPKSRRFVQVAFGPGGLTTEGLKHWSSVSLTFGYNF